MNKEEVKKFIGRHCSIEWNGGGMSGVVVAVDYELVIDYGYAIAVESITAIVAEDEVSPQA